MLLAGGNGNTIGTVVFSTFHDGTAKGITHSLHTKLASHSRAELRIHKTATNQGSGRELSPLNTMFATTTITTTKNNNNKKHPLIYS